MGYPVNEERLFRRKSGDKEPTRVTTFEIISILMSVGDSCLLLACPLHPRGKMLQLFHVVLMRLANHSAFFILLVT